MSVPKSGAEEEAASRTITMALQALGDLRVIDTTVGIAGSYCSKLFCDAGAEVVKVEPPGGDPLRRHAATTAVPEGEDGALFVYLSAGKRCVAAGSRTSVPDELLAGADIWVQDLVPPDVDVAGVRSRHPHLVVVSITPYGTTGPYAGRPASDLTVQAESGALLFKGRPDRPPVQAGGRIVEFLGGLFAAPPALAAVVRARREGVGEHIDLSLLEVMAISGSNFTDLYHQMLGRPEWDAPWRYVDTPGIEQAADGLVAFNANTAQMFESFLLLVGRPDLIGDRTYSGLKSRLALEDKWQGIIDAFVREQPVSELIELATELRIPAAPVHDGQSILDDEHLASREVFADRGDGVLEPRPPYLVDGAALVRRRPAPAVGHDERRIGGRGGHASGGVAAAPLPLEGTRVLDLTSWWVGASATQTLAHLGADVIHLESTSHPDGMRLTGPAFQQPDWWERGYMFLAANTNKRGLTLELDTPEGRRLLDDLIARADVLVENFSPRVAERWGLGPEQVHATNPSIVYVRMPAFGLTGPWRDRAAFAQTIEPMSGMAHMTGYPDDLPLAKGGLADAVAGQHGAWAIVVGLAERRRRGSGVFIEATMVEAALNVTAQPVLEYSAYGGIMTRAGNRAPHAAPQGVYPCVGPDSWVAISVCDDGQWEGLVAAVDDQRLKDADLGSHMQRVRHHDELDTILSEWSSGREQSDAVAELAARGVPAGACRDPRTVSEHPQLVARNFFETVEHPLTGRQAVPGPPYRFSSVKRWIRMAAPTLGQDNESVLSELVPSAEELLDLSARGIIGTRPKGL